MPQRQALQWMLGRELSPPTVAVGGMWLPTEDGGVFTERSADTTLVPDARGGLLADEPVWIPVRQKHIVYMVTPGPG